MIPRRHTNVPPGMIPTRNLTDNDLRLCGLDPWEVRQLERQLSDMGLGLGIKLPGFIKGIGKGIGKVVGGAAKGVAKGAKFVATKAIPTVVKTGIKVAPIALPAAGILKFGPSIVRTAGGLIKKVIRPGAPPPALPPGTPEPSVIEEPMYTTMPVSRHGPEEEARRKPQRPSVLDTLKRIAQEAAPLVPQVIERVTEREVPASPVPYVPPPSAAPSTTVVTVPSAERPTTVTRAGMDLPGWLLPAAGVALMLLTKGSR